MSERKAYIGDSVYVDVDFAGRVVLTTEDGIRATNTIVLEVDVLNHLLEWIERWKATK